MGQSLVKNYIHIIFSTKHRQAFIQPPYEMELHSYIGGICNEVESQVITVGGYTDHIHILCMLSKKIALMELVKKIKTSSSKWIKTKNERFKDFYWQDGYGAFSVDPNGTEQLVNYIKNQYEHHRKESFKDEYREFLQEYNVEYDERYVWD